MSRSPSVVVITASVGRAELRRCIESVQKQDLANMRHLVVVDGPEYRADAARSLDGVDPDDKLEVLVLPHNTGQSTN